MLKKKNGNLLHQQKDDMDGVAIPTPKIQWKTVEVFFGTLANAVSNVLVGYASTIIQVGRSFSGYVASVHMCMYNMFR